MSEIFPMETRALCISVFYAIGTGIGGITGPLVFQALIKTGDWGQAELALILGGVMMILGGIAEVIFGIKAEGRSLEDIAKPLNAEDTPKTSRTPAAAGATA